MYKYNKTLEMLTDPTCISPCDTKIKGLYLCSENDMIFFSMLRWSLWSEFLEMDILDWVGELIMFNQNLRRPETQPEPDHHRHQQENFCVNF